MYSNLLCSRVASKIVNFYSNFLQCRHIANFIGGCTVWWCAKQRALGFAWVSTQMRLNKLLHDCFCSHLYWQISFSTRVWLFIWDKQNDVAKKKGKKRRIWIRMRIKDVMLCYAHLRYFYQGGRWLRRNSKYWMPINLTPRWAKHILIFYSVIVFC